MNYGWAERPMPEEQLYDLVFDPGEVCNLAGDPEFGDVLEEMRNRLLHWMEETKDPLLEGPVLIKGIRVNDPDDISPRGPSRIT